MAAHQVTASDVQQALNSNNIQAAAGLIRSAEQSFSVTSNTDLHTASQFNHIVVRNQGGISFRSKISAMQNWATPVILFQSSPMANPLFLSASCQNPMPIRLIFLKRSIRFYLRSSITYLPVLKQKFSGMAQRLFLPHYMTCKTLLSRLVCSFF